MTLRSDELYRLLVPNGHVADVAAALNLSTSQIYQSRRASGDGYGDTGARNEIARLDTICELALTHAPEAVAMLGERYTQMHREHTHPTGTVTEKLLAETLARTSREFGEAFACLLTRETPAVRCKEVAEAKEWLERTLRLIAALEGSCNES